MVSAIGTRAFSDGVGTAKVAGCRSTGYAMRQMTDEDCPAKQRCRTAVFDHIMKYRERRWFRLLSLPSANWSFERMIHPTIEGNMPAFVACERDPSVFGASAVMMPGMRRISGQMELRHGTIDFLRSECAKIAMCDLSTLMGIGRGRHVSKWAKANFRDLWQNVTAVWLDFTCQLCREIEDCVPRLSSWCDMKTPTVPVALTFMGARETPDIGNKLYLLGEDRIGYAKRLLAYQRHRTFIDDGHFEYVSSSGTPMVTVLGRLVSKENHA